MKKILLFLAASALLADSPAADGAKELLKVPVATDRPAGPGAASPSPSAAPASSTPAPAKSVAEPAETPSPAEPVGEPADESVDESVDEGTEIVPAAFPVERYSVLWENSPFQTESVAPPVESPGLSQRFVLSGILRENGEYLVWVRERATQQSYMVKKNEPNSIGLSLAEVSESPEKQSEASATVRLGSEIGVIKFDAVGAPGVAMAMPAAVPPPIPQPGLRPMAQVPRPAVPQGVPAQAGVPSIPQIPNQGGVPAVPGVVPTAPGPGVPGTGQAQAAPGQEQMPPPRVIRRRAIVPAAP